MMQECSVQTLATWLNQNETLVLLDVREPWEYDICHITGSVLNPMGQIQQTADTLDSSAKTVVICHHGTRSLQVANYLTRIGFKHVYNLQGGIDTWAKQIDTTLATY